MLLYHVWHAMIDRCDNPLNRKYMDYGGRGIKVWPNWYDFKSFQTWAHSNGYNIGLQIDRKNNDGNYEPTNCHWTTSQYNNINQRNRRKGTSKFRGVHRQRNWWVAQAKVYYCTHHIILTHSELLAALAYDDFVFTLHGNNAKLNFPERRRNTANA